MKTKLSVFFIVSLLFFLGVTAASASICSDLAGVCHPTDFCPKAEPQGKNGTCSAEGAEDCPAIAECCCISGETEESFSLSQLWGKLGTDTGLSNVGEPTSLINRIGMAALGFVGIVVVALIIYGGIVWMTAAGNDEKVTKGKKIVVGSLIGMVIIVASYGIAGLVYNTIAGNASLPGGGGGGTNDCPTASSPHHSSVACYPDRADCEEHHFGTCDCGTQYGFCPDPQDCCYYGFGGTGGECASPAHCTAAGDCNPHTENDMGRRDCGILQTCCEPQ